MAPLQHYLPFKQGSNAFWLKSSKTAAGPTTPTSFDGTKSSTYSSSSDAAPALTYGDGTTVQSSYSSDTVTIGNLTVPEVKFAEAVSWSEPGREVISYYDGIMGLSFLPKDAPESFWALLISQGKVASPVIGYYIDETEERGGITFGGYDASRVSGGLKWVSLMAGAGLHWETPVAQLTVDGEAITLPVDHSVDFDTGTSLSVLPYDMAKTINSKLGLREISSSGSAVTMWGMACDNGVIPSTLPNVTFTLDGGVELSFAPKDYIWVRFNTNFTSPVQYDCVSGFTGKQYTPTTGSGSNSHPTIMGNLFLRKYYTVFDYGNKRIGVGEANQKLESLERQGSHMGRLELEGGWW
ncbi:Vacuolar protease A [Rhizophlyctis rosea]|nr:Vacuolar protease A [Rhizophlyctis rosea]